MHKATRRRLARVEARRRPKDNEKVIIKLTPVTVYRDEATGKMVTVDTRTGEVIDYDNPPPGHIIIRPMERTASLWGDYDTQDNEDAA